MRLHLFYPENDLALASGLASYTAPKPARRLSEAGALLPLAYGDDGDLALVGAEVWGKEGKVPITPALLAEAAPDPWGWSAAVRARYQRLGIDPCKLPTDEQLALWRRLSHRHTGALVARRLRDMLPGLAMPEPAIEARSEDELHSAIADFGQAMVKAPWSCSGRGVASTAAIGMEQAVRMGCDAIRRQGSVMVEPLMDRAIDFAKIYECREGRCVCLGTSVFAADALGHYAGNVLAPEAERQAMVGRACSLSAVEEAAEAIRAIIEQEIAPIYDGVVGVDMLADRRGMLHPVVEVNLRKTMGYVALRLSERLLAPGATGIMRAVALDKERLDLRPCVMADGRLAGGTMLLSPPTEHFAFVATVCGN